MDELEMENDLLKRENDILRRMLEEDDHPGEHGGRLIDTDEWRRLSKADKDLKWLLRRLGRPPFGWVMRRFGGFRTLESRHLDDA